MLGLLVQSLVDLDCLLKGLTKDILIGHRVRFRLIDQLCPSSQNLSLVLTRELPL